MTNRAWVASLALALATLTAAAQESPRGEPIPIADWRASIGALASSTLASHAGAGGGPRGLVVVGLRRGPDDAWLCAQWGPHSTLGHDVTITAVERLDGERLLVEVECVSPGPLEMVGQAFSHPAHAVRVDPRAVAPARELVLRVVARRRGAGARAAPR